LDKHPYQAAEEYAMDMNDRIIEALLERFPLPPDYEEMSNKDQMQQYKEMTPADFDRLVAEEGELGVARMVVDMERRRRRAGG